MLRHLPLVLKNTLRNKRRTILTTLSIAASLCLLGFLLAVYNMFYFEGSSDQQALRLIVRNKVSLANPLPISYQARIAQVPGVKEVTIFQWFQGVYKDARDPANFFARFAIEPAKARSIYPEWQIPDDQYQAFLNDRRGVLVGRKLAARHNFKIGDRVTIVGDIFPITLELTVRAIYDSQRDNENFMFHFAYMNEGLVGKPGADTVGTFVIRMNKPEDATSIAQTVDAMFRNAPQPTKTETERAFELSFLAFMGNVKAFLFSICAAITFTVLLVTGNTMAMSVRERVKEVGILKTLGFTNGGILSILLGESAVLSLAGGVLGLALATLLISVLHESPSMFADMSRLVMPAWVLGTCLVVAVVIGVSSAFVPAWNASRRPIIDAMRFTD